MTDWVAAPVEKPWSEVQVGDLVEDLVEHGVVVEVDLGGIWPGMVTHKLADDVLVSRVAEERVRTVRELREGEVDQLEREERGG